METAEICTRRIHSHLPFSVRLAIYPFFFSLLHFTFFRDLCANKNVQNKLERRKEILYNVETMQLCTLHPSTSTNNYFSFSFSLSLSLFFWPCTLWTELHRKNVLDGQREQTTSSSRLTKYILMRLFASIRSRGSFVRSFVRLQIKNL